MNDFLPFDASDDHEEFIALALRHLDGIASAEEETSLIDQLTSDPIRRQWFVALNRQMGMLREVGLGESGQWPVASDQCDYPSAYPPSALRPPPSFIPPIIVDSTSTLRWPVGNFILSHVAAAVILGIGLLIGLAWRISLPSPNGTGGTGYASVVARITALDGCQWTVQGGGRKAEGGKSPKTVFLGDRFTLASGLMEITYDTGAKVILEGPCTYEIDSDRGGYLAVGKLTARVEKKAEGGRRRAENADHYQLPTTNYQLFSVRTPSATVTDLGTEFGVEVEENGSTRSHVFQGRVEVRRGNSRGPSNPGDAIELGVGESANVERGRKGVVTITRKSGQSVRFVRQINKSTNHKISKSVPSSLVPRPSPQYRFTDLGTLGGAGSNATHLNNRGQVVGWAENSDGVSHAFLYADGVMKDIGRPSESSHASGINAQGVIVGDTGSDNHQRAFIYRDGKMQLLPTFGGRVSIARAVNDLGTVVGMSMNASDIGRAFIHTERDGLKDLGSLGGPMTQSTASDINAAGMVAGQSETRGGSNKAFLYTPGLGMKALDSFVGSPSEAFRINESGQVVGFSTNNFSKRRPFIHDKQFGVMELPDVDRPEGVAIGINNAGDVVGFATMSDDRDAETHAFVCRDGKTTDLNLLVDLPDGWLLAGASAINDSGQIVCLGMTPDNGLRAVLLTPIQGVKGKGQGLKESKDQ